MSGEDRQEEAVLAAVKPLKNSDAFANGAKSLGDSADYAKGRWTAIDTEEDSIASDAQRLESLFQRHHDRVFRTAYRVTGSPADAEDVLQTVFLRVARGQEAADTAENAEAYFCRAAINASLDLLRSRKRSKAVALDEFEESASTATFVAKDNPASDHEDRELRQLICQAVAKLGATAGQMFALRYFEGYGNGDIAKMMNTSPLVVGVTLHRARARLRKEIGRYLRHSD
ncbi:MAG TPA: sigma-70 family RNA polymerase sigma factor [Pyrinomonadaceae bacterium]|nr:sigma-70 family RNA polymerase sigma factor [Pyrinomonadaceae bacterium]